MKAFLAIAGVLTFGAGVYFLARGRGVPNTSSKQASGNLGSPTSSKNIAANLLTSQNLATLGGLIEKIGGGGAVAVAPPGGAGGSQFVTSYN